MLHKIISLVMVFVFFSLTAFGAEEIKIVNMDEIFCDSASWFDESQKMKIDNGVITREIDLNGRSMAYYKEQYQNSLFQFYIEMFDDANGKIMAAIALRASKPGVKSFSDGSLYTFNLRTNSVELQRYNNGVKVIGVFPADIDVKKPVKIKCGAVNVDKGVQLIFYVNDKLIINYFDEENGITQPGYFTIFNFTSVKMYSDKEEAEIPKIPMGLSISKYEKNVESLLVKYFSNSDSDMSVKWYSSDVDPEKMRLSSNVEDRHIEKFLIEIPKTEGCLNYTLKNENIGKYILAGVTDKNGNLSISKSTYIDPYLYKISKGIYMIVDYEKSLSNSEYKQIDPDNYYVLPEVIDGILYVPIRFIVEEFGGAVEWDDTKREVNISCNGNNNTIMLEYENSLSSPVLIKNSRTMVALEDVKLITGFDVNFLNEELFYISETKMDFEKEEILKLSTALKEYIIR